MPDLDFTAYDTLSFDCYGTLIDWEAGIVDALAPLLAFNVRRLEVADQLAAFASIETSLQQAQPAMPYPDILRRVHQALAAEFDMRTSPQLDADFGDSVADWPAYADSPGALERLAHRYRLVILSNVDEQSFAASARRLGITFDAVYSAERIGSYKPDPANFEYLVRHERGRLLHVAQSLFHDHVPAKAVGLDTVWIDRAAGRAGGATPEAPEAGYDARFESMDEFAAVVGL